MTTSPFAGAQRRIWVAGHRGMVGSALLRRLAQEDVEVLAYPVCCQYDKSVIICRSGTPRLSNNASRFSAGFSR